MTEPEDKGYKVEDRRFLHQSEEEKARIKEDEAARQAGAAAQEAAGPIDPEEALRQAQLWPAAPGAGRGNATRPRPPLGSGGAPRAEGVRSREAQVFRASRSRRSARASTNRRS